jgi:energy-coupling factor transporter ATP-binding protein EcfA2
MPQGPRRTHLYFTKLVVRNVRAFGESQELRLHDQQGRPAPWTLLLGENGVGKTTLLQCLARMRPVPGIAESKRTQASGADAGEPDKSDPELWQHENKEVERLVRCGSKRSMSIRATLANSSFKTSSLDPARAIEVGVDCTGNAKELKKIKFKQADFDLGKGGGPLVIGYGAARHIGHANKKEMSEREATASLFSDAMDLYDAEDVLGDLHYASMAGSNRDKQIFEMVKRAVAELLPEMRPEDIDVRGPRVPGRPVEQSGTYVTTPSGTVALSELSLGYQTVFAWTVDLAWRLYSENPNSQQPLAKPAIVLIDEIDLHLHPRWQRIIRTHLTTTFPAVQFIATTHSPITAQESLAAGENVSVVRCDVDHSIIINDPIEPREWRFDQILTSDLFGFQSARSVAAEALLSERSALIQKDMLTKKERRRLAELDGIVNTLPTASSVEEQEIRDVLREAASLRTRSAARKK